MPPLSLSPAVRQWLYIGSAALNAVGLIVVVLHPGLGGGILAAGASLGIAANMTAANNMTPAAATVKRTANGTAP